MKRVLFAGLFHETHTFLEGLTGHDAFQIRRGTEMHACTGDSSPLGGALAFAAEAGWEVLPTADYRAQPGPTVNDGVFEGFWSDFVGAAAPALADSAVDGIFLVLHGAMVTESLSDVEGEFLRRLRALPGAAGLPVVGVFDLHANVSDAMAANADALVAYRENPHTDAREAAVRAAEMLERCLTSGVIPRIHHRRLPMVWPPTGTGTATDPMKALEHQAREIEAATHEIWGMNVVAGFSFADTADTGVSVSAIADPGATAVAEAALESLATLAWDLRAKGVVVDPPVDEVLQGLNPLPPGLTVLVEPSDNIGGGAPGDGTGLLRALVRHDISDSAIAIADPEAVARLAAINPGTNCTLTIGGKGSRLDEGPLELEVTLLSQGPGLFELEDKQSHLASMAGDRFDMGQCAVVRHRGLKILLTSVKTPPFDLGQWRHVGIEPSTLSCIAVKAAVAHRRAYDGIAARMLWVDTPGPCTSDLTRLPYRRLSKEIFPFQNSAFSHSPDAAPLS